MQMRMPVVQVMLEVLAVLVRWHPVELDIVIAGTTLKLHILLHKSLMAAGCNRATE